MQQEQFNQSLLRRRWAGGIVLFAVVAFAGVLLWRGGMLVFAQDPTRVAGEIGKIPGQTNGKTYARFSHSSPGEHARFSSPGSCNECHVRRGNNPNPTFPGHDACIKCHQTQFTTPGNAICSICHTAAPAMKRFSPMRSFTALFDHAQHNRGNARPRAGCVECHRTAGAHQAIVFDLNTHNQCYTCHSPGASAANLSSCGTCHRTGSPPGRTSTPGVAYRRAFSHRQHDASEKLSCDDCHTPRAGAGRGRQVNWTEAAQHYPSGRGQNCATCHNDKPTFGEKDFGDCRKCHKGGNFRM